MASSVTDPPNGEVFYGTTPGSESPSATTFVESDRTEPGASHIFRYAPPKATPMSHQSRDHLWIAASQSRGTSPQRKIPPPPKSGNEFRPMFHRSPTPDSDPANNSLPTLLYRSSSTSCTAPGGHPPASARNSLLSPRTPFESLAQTPKSAPIPRKSLEHPPGYVQNPYAADLTPEQRFASQHSPTSPTLGYGGGSGGGGGVFGSKSPSSVFNFGALISPKSPREDVLPGVGDSNTEDIWSVVGGWFKGVSNRVGKVTRPHWTKAARC